MSLGSQAVERIETARLVGTKPLLRDADELHPLLADARVAEWLWPGDLGGPRTLAQTRALLVKDADRWKRQGFGPWVWRDAQTGAMVGRAGLAGYTLEGQEEVEIGYLIDADRWGQGLASEITRASIEVAFDQLGLETLIAFTQPHNLASRAVMERCGMTYEREFIHADLPHVLYRIRREN